MSASRAAILVYAPPSRDRYLRAVLGAACRATGVASTVEWYPTGVLYRRLATERAEPRADLVMTVGPYGLEVAAREDLLASHQPRAWPEAGAGQLVLRDGERRWWSLDFLPLVLAGEPPVSSFASLASSQVPRLGLADPARSETGTMAVLATLDRLRRTEGDAARAWAWWERRVAAGVVAAESPDAAVQTLREGRVSHALLLAGAELGGAPATWLEGLAPIPNAMGLTHQPPHADEARVVLDWLLGPEGAAVLRDHGGQSAWHAESNGLGRLADAAPPLDVDWTFGQYRSVRRNWQEDFPQTLVA